MILNYQGLKWKPGRLMVGMEMVGEDWLFVLTNAVTVFASRLKKSVTALIVCARKITRNARKTVNKPAALARGGFLLYNQGTMAKVKVLVQGYTTADAKELIGHEKTCPTISLVIDKNMVMVVDPGSLDNQGILSQALAKEGYTVHDVNMVCITHSHAHHFANVGMFPKAKLLEYFGLWTGGVREDWQENFTDDIQILKTPGHDYSGITLFVKTPEGTVAICGDVFWKENSPEFDMYASDQKALANSRQLVAQMSDWIIPGHAGMYKTKKVSQPAIPEQRTVVGVPAPKVSGSCKKCHRIFRKITDKCACQEWLCYHCCECEADCKVCNCKVRR